MARIYSDDDARQLDYFGDSNGVHSVPTLELVEIDGDIKKELEHRERERLVRDLVMPLLDAMIDSIHHRGSVKVLLIKAYRTTTGKSLKECKDLVEKFFDI